MTETPAIKIFEKDSEGYKRLKDFADKLNDRGKTITYTVEDTYFDFGQAWKWTTLIANREQTCQNRTVMTHWQTLCPRDQFTVIYGTDEEKEALATEMLNSALAK